MKARSRFWTSSLLVMISFASLSQENKSSLEVHGFIMMDAGYNFNSIDPNWFDVMRPTKLPAYPNEYGPAGSIYYSMRQTRLGFRTKTPTVLGEVKSTFDFDLFGFGEDAGQTTLHVINAFAELGKIGVGKTASPFMDTDIVPITLDYWGPCSRTFNFNLQFRYTIIQNSKQRLMVALEQPNAKADGGAYRPELDIQNVQPQFPAPNFAAHYRRFTSWGHVQTGTLVKLMRWHDLTGANLYDLSGQQLGWGFNVSSLIKANKMLSIKTEWIYGQGISNYFADPPPDIGLQSNASDPARPIKGKALPIWGFYVFTEWKLSSSLSSTVGYASETLTNSNLQEANAFRKGQYALMNLRYYPVDRVMVGVEYQFGRRYNFSDQFSPSGNKLQVSCKVNFSSGELK